MKQSPIEHKISKIVEPVLQDKGFSLVCVTFKGAELSIFAENPDTKRLGLDDCAMLSREIGALLEVEDPIKGRYRLEVSSPGIDRPLTKLEDFDLYQGFVAKIEVNPPYEGQKKFRGVLEGIEGSEIRLKTDTDMIHVDYECIEKAKLVMTDDIIEKSAAFFKRLDKKEKDAE